MNEWIKIGEVEFHGMICEEYVSKDGKLCKQVWNGGFEEIFKIAE